MNTTAVEFENGSALIHQTADQFTIQFPELKEITWIQNYLFQEMNGMVDVDDQSDR